MSKKSVDVKLFQKLYGKKSQAKIDSVNPVSKINRTFDILTEAHNAWNSLYDFRKECERNAMYTFGDQWADKIEHKGQSMTESDYIKQQGKVPLKNNRIRSIVRTVLGQFSSSQTEPVCVARDRDEQKLGEMMSMTIQYAYQKNRLWELDRRAYESFLINGAAFFKTFYAWDDEACLMDVWVDSINHNRVFFDRYMEDPRHLDCSLIGEIHDLGIDDILSKFSDGSREKAAQIREIYRGCSRDSIMQNIENLSGDRLKTINFYMPDDASRLRVIEIWRKETKERLRVHDWLSAESYKVEVEEERAIIEENRRRIAEQSQMGVSEENYKLIEYQWFVDRYWYFRFLSPYGDVLKEGETPYWHKSHPYSFKLYPFYNGEVHSFVSDFIDQQRYINRLITMQDFIMGAGAKGVLMFPEELKPDNMTAEDIAEEWVAYNGVIYYKSTGTNKMPQQIVSNSTQTGAYDMLNLQMQLLEEISGVSGALQGQTAKAGTAASLYAQQSQNSSINLVDLSESFRQLREDRDKKMMKLQQQYYTDKRYIGVAGKSYNKEAQLFNPEKVRAIEFDLSLTQSTSTASYSIVQNEMLMNLFEKGAIQVEELLENGSFPFADRLLQSIKTRKQDIEGSMQNQQPIPQKAIVPQDIQQQINQNVAQ